MDLSRLCFFKTSNSGLIISKAEEIQDIIIHLLKGYNKQDMVGAYICLNKPQKAVKPILLEQKIDLKKMFFIDCLTSVAGQNPPKEQGVLHISSPADLTGLNIAISQFIGSIPGKKFIIMDALSVLLVYNTEETVTRFVKNVTEEAINSDVKLAILTTETKGGNLLERISPFFDTALRL